MTKYFIAGDVGGTKTLLAYYSLDGNCHQPLYLDSYDSDAYPTLLSIVQDYQAKYAILPECVCLGVAGPVIEGVAQITNLHWTVKASELSAGLNNIPVYLINDLSAIAYSIPELEHDDQVIINQGKKDPQGTIAVVAPGTGLGEGYMVWNGTRYQPFPSEGGHCNFSPNSPLECELYQFMYNRIGHVSVERVCSGLGIPNIYAFLKEIKGYVEPEWLSKQIQEAEDQTPIIVNCAINKDSEISVATLDLFIQALASEAGNMALKLMATGGVYLGGGIPKRLIDFLKQPAFIQNFANKGRLSNILMSFPVVVIMRSDAALMGAARYGYEMLCKVER